MYGIMLASLLSKKEVEKSPSTLRVKLIVIFHTLFPIIFMHMNETYWIGPIILGLIIVCFSVLDLFQSFALFIEAATLVKNGLYSYIRHPIYLGYFFIISAFVLKNINTYNILLLCVYFVLTYFRIREEEKFLKNFYQEEFSLYAKKVPYKLIPFVF